MSSENPYLHEPDYDAIFDQYIMFPDGQNDTSEHPARSLHHLFALPNRDVLLQHGGSSLVSSDNGWPVL